MLTVNESVIISTVDGFCIKKKSVIISTVDGSVIISTVNFHDQIEYQGWKWKEKERVQPWELMVQGCRMLGRAQRRGDVVQFESGFGVAVGLSTNEEEGILLLLHCDGRCDAKSEGR